MSASERKAFQEATVRRALSRLRDPKGSRRFLVADEVGLGKTLIAQGVIEGLRARTEARGRAFRVFYLCSSLSIASQNTSRLLEVLPTEAERKAARVPVDRLALLPRESKLPEAPFHLYSLTPGTNFQGGPGRIVERVLLGRALQEVCPNLRAGPRFHRAMGGQAQPASWKKAWNSQQWPADRHGTLKRFRAQLALGLGLSAQAWGETLRSEVQKRLRDDDQRAATVALLRRAMTLAVVEELQPNLVIFDEFQRFFEVLPTDDEDDEDDEDDDHNEEARHVVRTMLRHEDDPATRPAVLLLSATPYRMYGGHREGGRHHQELFSLLSFLFGDTATRDLPALKEHFQGYRERLLRDPPGSQAVHEERARIEALLGKVMARTERQALRGQKADRGQLSVATERVEARDLAVFRHLAGVVQPDDRPAAEPYWSSIPYPLQMMREDYRASRDAELGNQPPLPPNARLTRSQLRDYSHEGHPHPKLRALLQALPEQVLALPWLPPSCPWWPLGGRFAEVGAGSEGPSKALVFSRFRAVPRALATLLSYEADRGAFQPRGGRRYGYWKPRHGRDGEPAKARKLSKGGTALRRPPGPAFGFGSSPGHDLGLLAMFLPLPRLASLGDPLRLGLQKPTREGAQSAIRERLAAALGVDRGRTRREPAWKWALVLERRSPMWGALRQGVEGAALTLDEHHGGAARACRRWLGEAAMEPAGAPTEAELTELADLALTGPGQVLWRAVGRVYGSPADLGGRIARVGRLSLSALRTYLDAPEWHLLLTTPAPSAGRRARPGHHAGALQRAVWEGNLEAVLDEYLVALQGLGQVTPSGEGEIEGLAELAEVLGLRETRLDVDGMGANRSRLSMRCHAALPFGLTASEATEQGQKLRSDTVRKAFNSPFRPMALVTTSIGQEGLDFHRYCRHIVHWDLPSNPVDLEQREGRVARYGGLSVRQALAGSPGALPRDRSPWHALSERWRAQEAAGGLEPWWHVEGATLRRTVVRPTFSEQERHLADLEEALALYRLALGQPDQEALVRALQRRKQDAAAGEKERLATWLREAALDLCPLPKGKR